MPFGLALDFGPRREAAPIVYEVTAEQERAYQFFKNLGAFGRLGYRVLPWVTPEQYHWMRQNYLYVGGLHYDAERAGGSVRVVQSHPTRW